MNTILNTMDSFGAMNTYFYSHQQPDCQNGCCFSACPEKYLYELQDQSFPPITRIAASSGFPPPFGSPPLQNGDLIILLAQTLADLEALVAHRDCFENFRVVLLIRREIHGSSRLYHQLNPRFIATVEQGLPDVRLVVGRMIEHSTYFDASFPESKQLSSPPSAR